MQYAYDKIVWFRNVFPIPGTLVYNVGEYAGRERVRDMEIVIVSVTLVWPLNRNTEHTPTRTRNSIQTATTTKTTTDSPKRPIEITHTFVRVKNYTGPQEHSPTLCVIYSATST